MEVWCGVDEGRREEGRRGEGRGKEWGRVVCGERRTERGGMLVLLVVQTVELCACLSKSHRKMCSHPE